MIQPISESWHSIIPRLVVDDTMRLVDFLKRDFEATGELHTEMPSEIHIGDARVLISGTGTHPSAWHRPLPRDPLSEVREGKPAGRRAVRTTAQ